MFKVSHKDRQAEAPRGLHGHVGAEDGIKVLLDIHRAAQLGQIGRMAVELGEDLIVEVHHFLHLLLRHRDGGF